MQKSLKSYFPIFYIFHTYPNGHSSHFWYFYTYSNSHSSHFWQKKPFLNWYIIFYKIYKIFTHKNWNKCVTETNKRKQRKKKKTNCTFTNAVKKTNHILRILRLQENMKYMVKIQRNKSNVLPVSKALKIVLPYSSEEEE